MLRIYLSLRPNQRGTWANQVSISITDAPDSGGDKMVEITYGETVERFENVEDASDLAKRINTSSAMLSAPESAENDFTGRILANVETTIAGGDDGADATASDYEESLVELEKDIINIVLLAGQAVTGDDGSMSTILKAHINNASQNRRERHRRYWM